jgi:signal transduction histidine kinase
MSEARSHRDEIEPRFSPMWTGSIVIVLITALVLAAVAIMLTVRSFRPVGEGQLLAGEGTEAADRLVDDLRAGAPIDEAVRRIRNSLEIDAVAVLDADGRVVASTSDTLVGAIPVQPMQLAALSDGRFTAMAGQLELPIEIDRVTALGPGDGVYLSTGPLDGDRALLLVYDVTELLERRAANRNAPEHVEVLAVGAGIGLVVAAVIAVARARARRNHEQIVRETGYLRRRAADLQSANEELERAHAETERALALAEEKNRIRAEFVLMINHELRTPLTAVVTGARLLETSDRLSAAEREIVADLVHEGERLDGLIGQMLAVARAENRGLTVNPVALEMEELMPRLGAAHRLGTLRVAEGIDLRGATVVTDATTLTQLVASLVDNALTHGATSVEIVVSDTPPAAADHVVGEVRPGDVYVMVVDDGPGIDPGFLPRAFEKFEKQSFSSGTGLGLYLARMMADSMGSPIVVATSDLGTTMAIGLETARTRIRVAS